MKASRLQAESVATELFDRTARTAELLERSRELYDSLRSLCDRNEELRTQSQSIVEHVRALLADEILMRYLIVVAALRRSQAA
jgi:DNA-binding transcriptional LysR family regulator